MTPNTLNSTINRKALTKIVTGMVQQSGCPHRINRAENSLDAFVAPCYSRNRAFRGIWWLIQRILKSALAPKAWLNRGLPGCKPGWTNQTFLVFKPGLPDLTIRAKSLVNRGIPGKRGNFGYPKNQENQTLTRLLKFLMNQAYQTLPYVQKAWLTRVFLVSLVSLVILRTRKTRLKPGSWNSKWTTLTRLEPYVQKAWLTRVFLVSLARLVN